MKYTYVALALVAALAACQPKAAAPEVKPAEAEVPQLSPLETVIAGEWRREDSARDIWRHPKETLEFFGVAPNQKVVEVWPGGGWYTNILGPYLATGGGQLVAAGADPAAVVIDPAKPDPKALERKARIEQRLADYKKAYSDPRYGTIEHSVFSNVSGPLTAPGTADTVLTFRNIHNWMAQGYADKFFTDAFAALKPGGTLGVVEHRLPSTATQDPKAASGYVHEDYVKSLATAAGFEFVEASEINANPKDTADHPFGVWTLPPVSTTTDDEGKTPEGFDPAKYKAIGESDRMTLKFRKPAAPAAPAAPN